jgi:hypothetical protein
MHTIGEVLSFDRIAVLASADIVAAIAPENLGRPTQRRR